MATVFVQLTPALPSLTRGGGGGRVSGRGRWDGGGSKGKEKEEEMNRLGIQKAQMRPPAAAASEVFVESLGTLALSLFNSPFQGMGKRSKAWGQKAFDGLLDKH